MEDLKNKISKEFNINDWDSNEGKKIKEALKNAIINITKVIKSSITNREKSLKIQSYLKGLTWISALNGIWKFISETTLNKPKFNIFKLDFDISNVINLGPTFWLKVALILLILRIIHKIISTSGIIVQDIIDTWKFIKNIFKKNIVNEGFFSVEEYKYLKLFE